VHFYTYENGKVVPKHFVPMSKDPSQTRPSRVTDAAKARKEGQIWYPSVTGILNVIDKPPLVNWKVEQHIQTAYEIMSRGFSSYESFLQVVRSETELRLEAAPKAGTDIHAVLENFIKNGIAPVNEIEQTICMNVVKVLGEHCGFDYNEHDFECEKYFINETFGFAGCADLVSPTWVIDFKSKQEASKFKKGKMAYAEHSRQLAAYGESLCEADTDWRAANIFISLETGEVDFHEHETEKLNNGWLDFQSCLDIYKRNTYNPRG
jgi:hypothetical protein